MRTVILACSATKRRDTAELAAIARYDGPAWRVLRAHMTCAIWPPFALSAEYGLISAYREIPNYDRRMTPERARALVDPVAEQLATFAREGKLPLAGETLMFGGGVYRDLLEQARQLAQMEIRYDIPITYTEGGIGEQLGQLKQWLITTPAPPTIADEEDGQ